MRIKDTRSVLAWRLAAAQNSLGRHWLKFHVYCQRLRAAGLRHTPAVVKRASDITISLLLLFLLHPLFLLIALLVKLEDSGPVFFAQTRVGEFGREFRMFK